MALSGAERARRCRENKEIARLSEVMKEKDRKRKQECLQRILRRFQTLTPSLEELFIFSDGSPSQFKQRFLFKNLSFLAKKFNINLLWHFFASNHGKGE